MSKWIITHSLEEANEQLAFLFANPEVKREIKRLLRLLEAEDDPRQPVNTELNIMRLRHHAPKWYRLRIDT